MGIKETFFDLSNNLYIHLVLIFILTDLISGLAKAIKLKTTNSSVGLNGLIRHILVLFIVVIVAVYMPLFQLGLYVNWILGYFLIQYSISIVENLGEIGFPLPPQLKNVIYKLNETFDKSIDGKLLKIETLVVNKQETIESKDINKVSEKDD